MFCTFQYHLAHGWSMTPTITLSISPTITPTIIFRKCGVKCSLGGQERHILRTNLYLTHSRIGYGLMDVVDLVLKTSLYWLFSISMAVFNYNASFDWLSFLCLLCLAQEELRQLDVIRLAFRSNSPTSASDKYHSDDDEDNGDLAAQSKHGTMMSSKRSVFHIEWCRTMGAEWGEFSHDCWTRSDFALPLNVIRVSGGFWLSLYWTAWGVYVIWLAVVLPRVTWIFAEELPVNALSAGGPIKKWNQLRNTLTETA